MKNNTKIVAQTQDTRRIRDYQFAKVADGFKAEGVELHEPGALTFESQLTKGKLAQHILRAERHRGESAQAIARGASEVRVARGDTYGSITYDDFFEGLGLEYKYDGKDIEEFFHLDDALKASLVKSQDDLRITARIDGLHREDGALLSVRDGDYVDHKPIDAPERDIRAKYLNPDKMTMTGGVEISTGDGHRYYLPQAIALDSAKTKRVMKRTFRWVADGLEIDVHVPAAYLAETKGTVMVDPSIVDDARQVLLLTWNERSTVRDSTGRLHIGYRGVWSTTGRWHAMHKYSEDNGLTWSDISVLMPTVGLGENQQYNPSLAIDSNDRLHAIFADHGHIPTYTTSTNKGPYADWGHRMRYAYCDSGCTNGAWLPADSDQQLIAATEAAHQRHYHIGVDGTNRVHIAWWENGGPLIPSPGKRMRYFQGNGTISERVPPEDMNAVNHYQNYFIVDNDDQVHWMGADRYGSTDVHHYTLNADGNSWTTRARLDVRQNSTGNSGLTRSYRANGVVGPNGDIHFINQLYNAWGGTHSVTGAAANPTHGIGYGRYIKATDTWVDRGFIREPDMVNQIHEDSPTITVDTNNVAHAVWRVNDPIQPVVLYARKTLTGGWTDSGGGPPGEQLLLNVHRQEHPQVRPRLAFPNNAANRNIDGNRLDIFIIQDGGQLVYFTNGGPLNGPDLLFPVNAGFVNTGTPQFTWRRLEIDDGSNTTYEVQVAPTPVFQTSITANAGTAETYTWGSGGQAALPNNAFRYWRVRGTAAGESGPYSPIFEVGVDTTAPSDFALNTPVNNSDPADLTPTFTWQTPTD